MGKVDVLQKSAKGSRALDIHDYQTLPYVQAVELSFLIRSIDFVEECL